MKNPSAQLLLSTLGVVAILAIGLFSVDCTTTNCRSIEGDFDTSSSLVTPSIVHAGESFEQKISINLADEFTKRYSVPLAGLESYHVTQAAASFTADHCPDLSSYSITVSFPQLGDVTESDRCSFPEYQTVPDVAGEGSDRIAVYFTTEHPGTNPVANQALKTDFAENFKNGDSITAVVRFTAKNDIPAGFGIKLFLRSKMRYQVCE